MTPTLCLFDTKRWTYHFFEFVGYVCLNGQKTNYKKIFACNFSKTYFCVLILGNIEPTCQKNICKSNGVTCGKYKDKKDLIKT